MSVLLTKARTALALGLPNIARVASYSAGVRLGINPVRRLRSTQPAGAMFMPAPDGAPIRATVPVWEGSRLLFSRWPIDLGDNPPDWLSNPLSGRRVPQPCREWWAIPDFDPDVGDIKLVWELSRMDWVLTFAQRARAGDTDALVRLNTWLRDWFEKNPPYCGPNWKCGQEASIRVMHLACAAILLGQVDTATPALRTALVMHLQRIAPTVQYAMAQDNNHGTSEAVALFVGGSWLNRLGIKSGAGWERTGRRMMENRAARLIAPDGSFSQYSLNYHRLMLDCFSFAEAWRSQHNLPAFTARLITRVRSAAEWLRNMVDPRNGDAPNLGANDGARLLQLAETPYRDFRPSVQLAFALFLGQRAYDGEGTWNDALRWLGIDLPRQPAPALSHYVANDGGFALLRSRGAAAMLRYPRFRFRPSQADVLHLDLWIRSENILRDGGTYSYNTDSKWLLYFGGTASHNTVQFDGRDQMPRLTRFLLGDWLRTRHFEPLTEGLAKVRLAAGYTDQQGAHHTRAVELGSDHLCVVDEINGRFGFAVLRWRLAPGEWTLHTDGGINLRRVDGVSLSVSATMHVRRCELVEGWESRHYLEKTAVPVLEVEVDGAGTLTTEVRWAS